MLIVTSHLGNPITRHHPRFQ